MGRGRSGESNNRRLTSIAEHGEGLSGGVCGRVDGDGCGSPVAATAAEVAAVAECGAFPLGFTAMPLSIIINAASDDDVDDVDDGDGDDGDDNDVCGCFSGVFKGDDPDPGGASSGSR